MIPSENEELSSWQRKGVSLFGKLFMLYDKKTIRRYMPHGMKFDAKYSICLRQGKTDKNVMIFAVLLYKRGKGDVRCRKVHSIRPFGN